MTPRRVLAALAVCAALGGCGGADPADSASSGGSAAKDDDTAAQPAETRNDATSSSGGEQPALEWEPVDGASLYSVVVADGDGTPFWGWQGSDTMVTVGDGAPDPLVGPEMTWSVVAIDAAGDELWESGTQPV